MNSSLLLYDKFNSLGIAVVMGGKDIIRKSTRRATPMKGHIYLNTSPNFTPPTAATI